MLPHRLDLDGGPFVVDRARAQDVPAVVALLRDDALGAGREAGADELGPYLRAFAAVDADPHQLLVVVRDATDAVVATLQLTLLHGLSRGGATRLQVEAVRVASTARGAGLGAALLAWAVDHGRARGAVLAQLTTDLRRTDAHRFYERLGWVHSHAGMKLDLR
ncbi:acetyltransferase (GNAT) family protein [Phycicoccus duodecadis]|uniref:Acetyltransferase (GNAT) family protein n=2 Tax=Phycicoccus duodecadis TaxID=173053 RepID=A0A2N3YL40_9MICO|nr:GNAT family N-acetyltransferase [Phycicoccus duodecadis]PKW27554.1 acetyltransferase (GNAT) family protein [Phycicoccus duodecadis]